MKLSTNIFVVVAVLAAVAYGSSAKDRNRWLAAMGFSHVAATEIRIENSRAKFRSDQAEELTRRRGDDLAPQANFAPTGTVLTLPEVCAGFAQKQELLRNQGKAVDAGVQHMQKVCSGDAGNIGD